MCDCLFITGKAKFISAPTPMPYLQDAEADLGKEFGVAIAEISISTFFEERMEMVGWRAETTRIQSFSGVTE